METASKTSFYNNFKNLLLAHTARFEFWFWLVGSLFSSAIVAVNYFNEEIILYLGEVFKNRLSCSFVGYYTIFSLVVPAFLIVALIRLVVVKRKLVSEISKMKLKASGEKNVSITESIISKYLKNEIRNRFTARVRNKVEPKVKAKLSIFPIHIEYLKLIREYSKIIIFTKTTIEIRTVDGKSAVIKRTSSIMNTGFEDDFFQYKWFFTKQNKITQLHIDGVDKTEMLQAQDHQNFEIELPKKFPRFDVEDTDIELNVINCFIGKKEFWQPNNKRYPILWEHISIKLREPPKKVACLKKKGYKWIQASDEDATFLGITEEDRYHSVDYLLNYQELDRMTQDHKKEYKIVWEK